MKIYLANDVTVAYDSRKMNQADIVVDLASSTVLKVRPALTDGKPVELLLDISISPAQLEDAGPVEVVRI